MYKLLLLAGGLILGSSVLGQMGGLINNEIDFKYKERPQYSEKDGLIYNNKEYLNHPEFGYLPFDKPHNKNVVEVLEKRTATERYYVDIDNPSYFYIQKGAQAINYQKEGNWLAISPYLERKSEKLYRADNQPFSTSIDLDSKKTFVIINGETFGFNNYSMIATSYSGSTSLYHADWSDIVVGNKAAYITNVFPDIDMQIVFKEGAIKSEFIIHEETQFMSITFSDKYELPNGYYFEQTIIEESSILLKNGTDDVNYARIDKVRAYDYSANQESWSFEYVINQNKLQYILDSAFLHNQNIIYPLVIDPLFTAVGPVSNTGGVIGSLANPGHCSNNIDIVFPGGSQPWDVSASWSVTSDACRTGTFWGIPLYTTCYLSVANVRITSNCGGISPNSTQIWSCPSPTCDYTGTWSPSLPFNSLGTQSLAQCYTGSCLNQNMSYSIELSRSSCSATTHNNNCTYNNNRVCVKLESWSITVQGRTLETLGNQSTGNGSLNITPVSCSGGNVTLDPTAQYGVPGYSYLWSTGATTPTISIQPYPYTGQTVAVNVTDACGVTRIAQFQIQCPLAVSLTAFNVENLGKSMLLEWTTETETNNDYFEVYRSEDGKEFEVLDKVQGAGNSTETINYNYKDIRPFLGISYYKLGIVDMDGNTEFTDIKTVQRNNDNQNIQLIPNPAKENVAIAFEFPTTAEYEVKIIDALGKERFLSKKEFKKGMQTINVNTENYSQGVYMVMIVTKNNVNSAKLVIQ